MAHGHEQGVSDVTSGGELDKNFPTPEIDQVTSR